MSEGSLRIHLLQWDVDPVPATNRKRLLQWTDETAEIAGGLVVLTEMFSTGFITRLSQKEGPGMHDNALEDRAAFAEAARRGSCYVYGAYLDFQDGFFRNICEVYDPRGQSIARYQKTHTFTIGGEGKHFSKGDKPVVCRLEGFVVQLSICYDLRFPELFRWGRGQGAQVVVVPAHWPKSRARHWEVLLQARAVENQCWMVGVNRVGVQEKLEYAGGSLVVSPKGEVVAGGGGGEEIVSADLGLKALRCWREKFPVWEDRRPDLFGKMGNGVTI